ncbi:MAG: VIT1/CCC1 transporter family protein [Gemmatimonadaceae bacterium]
MSATTQVPTTTAADIQRYRGNLQGEVDSATLYRAMAATEHQPQLASVYQRLAATEDEHAARWEQLLREAGASVPARRAGWRVRVLVSLARRFGASLILPVAIGREAADSGEYDRQPESSGTVMPEQERLHGRLLRAIAGSSRDGVEGSILARYEGRHRTIGGNALRAAVLGANDGLVSNLSLVMGVAGAALSERVLLVTGIAGLLAGAGSMAMGEWLSVQSSRELNERQLGIEQQELTTAPEEEAEELALIYQAKGLPEDQARSLAARLLSTPDTALDTLAREELGIDPRERGGSPWEAAITSFFLFAAGAIVPVLPFIFLRGTTALIASITVSAAALFLIGAGITLLTGRSVIRSGMRSLLIGLGAAGLTYAVGRLIGVSVTG